MAADEQEQRKKFVCIAALTHVSNICSVATGKSTRARPACHASECRAQCICSRLARQVHLVAEADIHFVAAEHSLQLALEGSHDLIGGQIQSHTRPILSRQIHRLLQQPWPASSICSNHLCWRVSLSMSLPCKANSQHEQQAEGVLT